MNAAELRRHAEHELGTALSEHDVTRAVEACKAIRRRCGASHARMVAAFFAQPGSALVPPTDASPKTRVRRPRRRCRRDD